MALRLAHVLVAQLSVAQTMYVNVRCGPIADCCVVAASHLLLLCSRLQALGFPEHACVEAFLICDKVSC